MGVGKRRRSHTDNDQRTTQKLPFGESEHDSNQSRDPKEIFSDRFGDWRLAVKLQSLSKAAQNDPKPPYSSALELRKPGDNGTAGIRSIVSDVMGKGPDLTLNSSDKRKEVSTKQAGSSIYQEEGDLQNRSVSASSTRSRNSRAKEPKSDSTKLQTNHVAEEASSSSNLQTEYDEYESDQDILDNDNCSENHELYDCKWIEDINVKMTSIVDRNEQGDLEVAGYCDAKLIRRDRIRNNFYTELENPTEQTSWLAFDLFDRYGCLRSEFTTHPFIKGTGVWGQEIDHGDILLIEVLYVKKAYRRQHLGRRMVEALLQVVQRKTRSFTAFSLPSLLNLHDVAPELYTLQDDAARDEMNDRERGRAIAFFRSLGFRRVGNSNWFAATTNHDHLSQKLASTADIDPPKMGVATFNSLLRPFQQIIDLIEELPSQESLKDPAFLGALQNCFQQQGPASLCWKSTDRYGNNLLHLASKIMDTACVAWILKQDFGPRLIELRNQRGETPMECLKFHLEKLRTQREIMSFTACISDEFKGHSKDGVHCLALFQGFPDLDSFAKAKGILALHQLTGGCTCGKCIDGFLSPRMVFTLRAQAEIGYDMLDDQIDYCSGSTWVQIHDTYFRYASSALRGNLARSKSARQGFVNLWKHIASCLEHNKIPNEHNVLEGMRSNRDGRPAAQNFLDRGGTVEMAFLAVCEVAKSQDDLTGDGEFAETFGEDIAGLPECRNDREFGFVSGRCGYRPRSRTQFVYDE